MRGVIIWHCLETRRAVVWCDDSGELAYASDAAAWAPLAQRVAIGDYVAFDLDPSSAARSCRNLRLIESGLAPELAGILRAGCGPARPRWPAPVQSLRWLNAGLPKAASRLAGAGCGNFHGRHGRGPLPGGPLRL
jgi:hypothetical protein